MECIRRAAAVGESTAGGLEVSESFVGIVVLQTLHW